MGIFSRFEDKMEDTVEDAASRVSKAPISPVQIAKKAERRMRRETMVGAGKEYAPTLYTVLVNPEDDSRLFGYYPTLAGEIETYLMAKADQAGLAMDGTPLVRFIVDDSMRRGKFDVVAETVAAPLIAQLRDEEMAHYGIAQKPAPAPSHGVGRHSAPAAPAQEGFKPARRANFQGGYDDYDLGGQGAQDYGYDAAPRPSGSGHARLFDLKQNRPYDLSKNTVILGREKSCDIQVNDANASRRHAQVALDANGMWVATDLGSTNGTLVNGNEITSVPLYVGDVITIGKTDYEFELA